MLLHDYKIREGISRNEESSVSLTPVECHGGYLVKRDDLYEVAGSRGGKARSCYSICSRGIEEGFKGFVTAGSRQSPQIQIASFIAKEFGVPLKAHTPGGEITEELKVAIANGAEIVQEKAGYNGVIKARARETADSLGWLYIPFGMQCEEAVIETGYQVKSLKKHDFNRLVVPVGSGMSLAGILRGLEYFDIYVPVLGVSVGANYEKVLDEWAPVWWREDSQVRIVKSPYSYSQYYENNKIGDLVVDPIYEAKCIDFLEEGDLLWVVGIRDGF